MMCCGHWISSDPPQHRLRYGTAKSECSVDVATNFDPVRILEVLARHGVTYVLIGGYAALLHGSSLPTTDLDITPDRSRQNLANLATALHELGARVRVDADTDPLPFSATAESLQNIRVLNLTTAYGDLDLAFEPAGFPSGFDGLGPGSTAETIGGVTVQVASLDDIITSKEAAGRDKDINALPLLIMLRSRGRR